ncbi:MAG: NAD(P)H-hydrate dehydratase [Chloroflexota bacterium]
MYIVTAKQMQVAESKANDVGHSYDQMMEQAGRAVAEVITSHVEASSNKVTHLPILILVGPGNNGGDGLVAARYLAQKGAKVILYIWNRALTNDPNWERLKGVTVESIFSNDSTSDSDLSTVLETATIIVDALLGTGVSRPIKGSLGQLLDQIKTSIAERHSLASPAYFDPTRPSSDKKAVPFVTAVDLPSGLNSDTGIIDPYTLPADLTVTFGAAKYGHIIMPGPTVVGQLVIADIRLSDIHYPEDVTLRLATTETVAAWLPARPVGAHKGTFGQALLIAGSVNYTGAALLAGRAAARSGAGLVTIAPPQTIYPMLASSLAEATYLPLPDDAGTIAKAGGKVVLENLRTVKALLIGPGLGQAGSVGQFLIELLKSIEAPPPLILDADALNILAQQTNWWELLPPNAILTPHPGEMSRLTGLTISEIEQNRLEIARQMAAEWNQIVLLKGAHTIIAAPDGRMMVMPFANPALAKAGSGDVLAGTIVGLRAQGVPAFEAAICGAYLHGLAGELARDQLGVTAVVAGDLVDCLALAYQAIQNI